MKETRFKQTEIGLIPEDWEVLSVGKDCTVKARIGWQGLTTSEYMLHGKYGLITSTDIVNGKINWNSCSFVSKFRYEQDKNIIIKAGDILISKDGTIGKVGIVSEMPYPATLNSGVFVVRSKNQQLQYATALAFISPYFKDFIKRLTAGSTIIHLYQKDIVKFTYPVPKCIEEQNQIASALTSIDNLLLSLDKLIEKKRLIKQGAMQELLTGKKRLPGFTGEWVELKLGKLCDIFGRIGFRGYTKADLVKEGNGAISFSPSDINSNKINYNTCTYISYFKYEESPEIQVFNGDIIFCKTASIGKCALVENLKEKATINPQFVVMKNFNCDNRFLYYRLIDESFQTKIKKIAGGSTIPTMSQEKLKEETFVMPENVKEQKAISRILASMDKEIESLEGKKAKYEQIKQGMMQQLLTGKIRLI